MIPRFQFRSQKQENMPGNTSLLSMKLIWNAAITTNKLRKHLGRFDTAEEAYEEYCKASKEYHKEFAKLL